MKPDRVYFYGTCLIDLFYPDAGLSSIKLLEREGIKVIYPQEQTCCGQPAMNAGYVEEAKRVIQSQIEFFIDDIPIIIPSGSCASMMRYDYSRIVQNDRYLPQVVSVSKRVYELTEFLHRVLNISLNDLGSPVRIVNHVSCSSLRYMKVEADAYALLRQLKYVDIKNHLHAHECCGFGGTFAVKHDEISAAMTHDKVSCIAAEKAEVLVTGDCGCLINIEGCMRYENIKICCKHIAEFLWDRTSEPQ